MTIQSYYDPYEVTLILRDIEFKLSESETEDIIEELQRSLRRKRNMYPSGSYK